MTVNTTICNSGFGAPTGLAPFKVEISRDIMCTQLGLQNRNFECEFLNILLAAYRSPFSFTPTALAIWGVSNFDRNLSTALEITQILYKISKTVYNTAVLISSPVKPNEILVSDLCRNAPDQAAYGTRDSYFAAITTALAIGDFEPLFSLVATDYYAILWHENCQCTPDPDPTFDPLKVYEVVVPESLIGCSGGPTNIAELRQFYAFVNAENARNNAMIISEPFLSYDPIPTLRIHYKAVPGVYPDIEMLGGTYSGFERFYANSTRQTNPNFSYYSASPTLRCDCVTNYTCDVILQFYRYGYGSGALQAFWYIPRVSNINARKCVKVGVYKEQICREFPALCGCVKKTRTVQTIVKCGEFVDVEVTENVEQYPNGCLRRFNPVRVSAERGCGTVNKSVESLIIRPEESF